MANPNSPLGVLKRSASERGWNTSVKAAVANKPSPTAPSKLREREESLIDAQAVLNSELNFLGLNTSSSGDASGKQSPPPPPANSVKSASDPLVSESVLLIPTDPPDDSPNPSPSASCLSSSPSTEVEPSTPSSLSSALPLSPSMEQLGRSASGMEGELDAKANEQRIRIVNELLSTEDTYVNSLQILFTDYYKPMRAASMLYGVTRPQVATIFSCFEALMNFHQSFVTALRTETEAAQSGNLSPVWTLFLKQVDYLKMYSTYMTNYPKAAQVISQLKDQPKFQGLLTRNREKRGLDLMSYLIMPVQRIPRYELLLREVMKSTPRQHPEYSTLLTLYTKVQQIAGSINEGQRQMENMSKLVEVQNRLTGGFQLLIPGRNLIRDGALSKFASGFLGTQSTHTRLFFLFNDKLLWATTKYEYRGHVELIGATLSEIEPGAVKAERSKSPAGKVPEAESPASPSRTMSRSKSPASRRFVTLGKDFKVSQALDVPSPLLRQSTEGTQSTSEKSPMKSLRLPSRLSLSSSVVTAVPSIKIEGPICTKGDSEAAESEKFLMFTAASMAEHEAWKSDLEQAIKAYRTAVANKDKRTSLGVPMTQLGEERKSRDSANGTTESEQAAAAAGVSPQLIEATKRANKASTLRPASPKDPQAVRKLSM